MLNKDFYLSSITNLVDCGSSSTDHCETPSRSEAAIPLSARHKQQ